MITTPNYTPQITGDEVNCMICDLEHKPNPTPADKCSLEHLRNLQKQMPNKQSSLNYLDKVFNEYLTAHTIVSDLRVHLNKRLKADKISFLYYRYR